MRCGVHRTASVGGTQVRVTARVVLAHSHLEVAT